MNLTIAPGSAIAVLLAVAMTGLFAFGIVALYLSHQRKQSRIERERSLRSDHHDRARRSLREILASSWEVEDAMTLLESVNGGPSDASRLALRTALIRGSDALIELSLDGSAADVVDSYRSLRRAVHALDETSHAQMEDRLVAARSRVEAVERLVRARLAEIDGRC